MGVKGRRRSVEKHDLNEEAAWEKAQRGQGLKS